MGVIFQLLPSRLQSKTVPFVSTFTQSKMAGNKILLTIAAACLLVALCTAFPAAGGAGGVQIGGAGGFDMSKLKEMMGGMSGEGDSTDDIDSTDDCSTDGSTDDDDMDDDSEDDDEGDEDDEDDEGDECGDD